MASQYYPQTRGYGSYDNYNYSRDNSSRQYRGYNSPNRDYSRQTRNYDRGYDNRYDRQRGLPRQSDNRDRRGYVDRRQLDPRNKYSNQGGTSGGSRFQRDREDRKDGGYNRGTGTSGYNPNYQNYQNYQNYRGTGTSGYNQNRGQGNYRRDYNRDNRDNRIFMNDKYGDLDTGLHKSKNDNFDYEADDWKEKIKKPEPDTRVKTEDVTQTKGSSFADFNLKKPLLRAIYEMGYERPSPVQEESIPNILMRHNVLARAKNGTGKTAAYGIPILQTIDPRKNQTQALVLVPTRELALQTAKAFKDLSKYLNLAVLCTTGGMYLKHDIIRLRNPIHIIVATPGRILDLARAGHAKLGNCGIVAIDEADKLLSVDFSQLVERILEYIPSKLKDADGDEYERQLLLYSATFPMTVAEFCSKWLKTRKEVNLMEDLTLKGVTQYYAYINEKQKVHALFSLVRKLEIQQCVIFAKTVTRVELLARKLTKLGFSCFYIHSRMEQKDRARVFHEFRQGPTKCRFLVCTDLITRGVDVPTVNVVINFDFPKTGETYLHRIGRGGRFGHLALAINFVTDKDRDRLYQVEHHLQTEIKPIPNEVDKIDTQLYAK